MNKFFSSPLLRGVRPVHVVLATCFIIFLLATSRISFWEHQAAPALAELRGGSAVGYGISAFEREYMADPYGKAVGMSERQLQLCSQVYATIPGYESGVSWRNTSVYVALIALGYLAYQRYASRVKAAFREARRKAQQAAMEAMMQKMGGAAAEQFKRAGGGAAKDSPVREAVVSNIVTCPSCNKELRVPSGKGRIRITCSSCGNKFETVT
jgi:hypothetical protein